MSTLTNDQLEHVTRLLQERKPIMREEIRFGLGRMRSEGYEELLSGTSDAGDESLASVLTDITNADVVRDATELQDIFAAEARLAAGTYGECIECGEQIRYARLVAHPTAKRCIRCQQIHESNRAPMGFSWSQ